MKPGRKKGDVFKVRFQRVVVGIVLRGGNMCVSGAKSLKVHTKDAICKCILV